MSDYSDGSDKEAYDELGFESGSSGTCSTVLGGFLCGLIFPLGVTLSTDELFNSDRGSFALPYINVGELCNRECTDDENIFYIAWMLAESWIDPMFIKFAGMCWIELVWF